MDSNVISRAEAYLEYAQNLRNDYPEPVSRIDFHLLSIAQQVKMGGADIQTIKDAINDYLTANPPGTMTDTQIADSVNRSIVSGDINVGGSLTTEQEENIAKVPDMETDITELQNDLANSKIASTQIVNRELIITYTDGTVINLGEVVGEQGEAGETYTPEIGTVNTVDNATSASASVTNDDDTKTATFNFNIPKGEDGFTPKIEVLTSNDEEYTLKITNSDATITTPNLKGAGDNIFAGTKIDGTSTLIIADITGSHIGDIYINANNGNLYVRDDANSINNHWTYKGNIRGIQGKSNYDLAVDNGFIGTEQDYLDSLVGESNATEIVPAKPILSDDSTELKKWYYYQVDGASGDGTAWKYKLYLPTTADFMAGKYAVYFNMKPYCGEFTANSLSMTNKDTYKYYILMDLQAVTSQVIQESIADGSITVLETVQCAQQEPTDEYTVVSEPIIELGKWVQTLFIGATKEEASEVTLSTGTSVSGFVTSIAFEETVGSRSNLKTLDKTSIVNAINEHEELLRENTTDSLNTNSKNVIGAINELNAKHHLDVFDLVGGNVLDYALTTNALTYTCFYANNCDGLPDNERYGYCYVEVSQDPLYRDLIFNSPTTGRRWCITIGAATDNPTMYGEWSEWHEELLREDIASVLDDTVTNKQVAGAKDVYEGLEKKFDKTNITKVLDDTVTDEQTPSALATYNATVNKNLKTYTMLEQIGLASGTTVSEIFLTMPDNSMVEIGTIPSSNAKEGFYCIDDLPDSTVSGILTVIKYNYARFNIIFKSSAGNEIATNDIWIGNLKGTDGTGLTWSKLVLEETHNMNSYYALKQLGLDSTATINQVLTNMALGSIFVCQIVEFDDLTQFPTTDTTMAVYLVKYSMARVLAMCYDKIGNYYVGLISSSNTLAGWKKISMITDLNHSKKIVTFTATAGTWTRIAKFTGNALTCKGAGNNSINVILKRVYGNNNTEYLDFDYIGMYGTKKFIVNKQFSDAQTFKTLRYTYDSVNSCCYIEVWRSSSSTNDSVTILNNITCVTGSWEIVNKDTTESLTVLASLDLSTANKDKTAISYTDGSILVNENASFYTIRNGICYVSLYMKLTRAISSSLTVGTLPSPVMPQYHVVSTYSGTVYNEANLIVLLDSDGKLKISGGTFNSSVNGSGYYSVSFTYPVAE